MDEGVRFVVSWLAPQEVFGLVVLTSVKLLFCLNLYSRQ